MMASPSISSAAPYAVPCGKRVEGEITPPPSKSVSHRVLNLAFLAGSPVRIERLLDAEDIRLFLAALGEAGLAVERRGDGAEIGPGAAPAGAVLCCGNAGTMARFLVAACSALPGEWTVDGSDRLRERPVGPLVSALRQLGAEIEYLGRAGCPPVRVRGGSLRGGRAQLDAGKSSQYLSALLMAGLQAREPLTVEVGALTSEPYVAVTRRAVADFGGRVEEPEPGLFRVWPGLSPPRRLRVEGDYSAACYPAAAAALTGGRVRLLGLDPASAQGDRAFFDLLRRMGARVEVAAGGWEVEGSGALAAPGEVDLSAMPDQVPTLAALAPFARGVTRITRVAHLRIKESDRLAALARELGRVGAAVTESPGGLAIPGLWAASPPPSAAVTVDSHDDHRIAMSLALLGLRRPGVSVAAPEVVGKSYPGFWRDLEALLGVDG